MLIGGIDEAGRGPVIGPMVMAIAVVRKEDEFKLQTMSVKDSKLLTKKRRDELYGVIQDLCQTLVIKVSPKQVDKAVLSSSDNLNWIEARTAAKLINKVTAEKVVLDCPSTNLDSFRQYIMNHVKDKKIKLVIEHQADVNHLIVSAASVIAKVTRDAEIEKIKKKIGIDFGSGYSSDPKTQVFVEKHWNNEEFSPYIRKSWDTWKKHHDRLAQKSLEEY